MSAYSTSEMFPTLVTKQASILLRRTKFVKYLKRNKKLCDSYKLCRVLPINATLRICLKICQFIMKFVAKFNFLIDNYKNLVTAMDDARNIEIKNLLKF